MSFVSSGQRHAFVEVCTLGRETEARYIPADRTGYLIGAYPSLRWAGVDTMRKCWTVIPNGRIRRSDGRAIERKQRGIEANSVARYADESGTTR